MDIKSINIETINFDIKMIVYKKSEKRVNNFLQVKKILPQVELFEAIDTINEYEKYKEYALQNNYVNNDFINICEQTKNDKPKLGVLGCNLSHIILLKEFIEQSQNEWLLVLEDDLKINNYNPTLLNKVIQVASKNKSNYVQLYTNPRFIYRQKMEQRIDDNIYKMISQWHTTAYLINKTGAKILLDKLPLNEAIDLFIGHTIHKLNALCYLNNMFINIGALHPNDKKSECGSLLWNI